MVTQKKHLKKETQLVEFLKAVKHCKGPVFFETDEGDKLTLGSVLSQYIFCNLANDPQVIETSYISLTNPEDLDILQTFFIN